MRRQMMAAGWFLWGVAAIGVAARYIVMAYHGEASWMLWLGLALVFAGWAWGKIAARRREPQPEPRKFTIYDWTEEPDGVRFHARYDDGEELEFVHTRGMTGSRSEAAS